MWKGRGPRVCHVRGAAWRSQEGAGTCGPEVSVWDAAPCASPSPGPTASTVAVSPGPPGAQPGTRPWARPDGPRRARRPTAPPPPPVPPHSDFLPQSVVRAEEEGPGGPVLDALFPLLAARASEGPFSGHHLLDMPHPRPHRTQEPFLTREALVRVGAPSIPGGPMGAGRRLQT